MKICDEAQRKTILAHADNVRDDLQRERRKIMTTKGVSGTVYMFNHGCYDISPQY